MLLLVELIDDEFILSSNGAANIAKDILNKNLDNNLLKLTEIII
jgi:hypothetical protein